jgi:Tfp pilus assembly protein PilE
MWITETMFIYVILLFVAVGAFGGWLLKVAIDQMKADRRREAEAEERSREYEQSYIAECEERIKDLNRQQTMYWWLSEVKGGAKK